MITTQSTLGVIGNIAFPSSRNKGKIPYTDNEFTWSAPVAKWLPISDVRNVLPSLSQTSSIELRFGVKSEINEPSAYGCN